MSFGRKLSFALLGLLLSTIPLQAQRPTGVVMGRVTDASTQQPLSGVTVLVGERGALTDANGRYTVGGIQAGSQTLRAILLGYKEHNQQIAVAAGQTQTVDIAMAQQAVQLAQLVVVGYGTQRASSITGAVKQVTPAEFNTGRIVAPEELFKSKVSGVQVVDNNEPGGGVSIRVRGATSINASSDPLYVIDGVPLGSGAGAGLSAGRNPLNFLNPEDIASITVLKDAASASIYGANAANGVVLITTKTGRRGPQMEYTGSVSGSVVTRLPDMLNAQQFRAAVTQYAPQNVNQLSNASTDWFSQVDRKALGQDHHLAFSSTGDNSDYRLAFGYTNQDGVIKGTNLQRLTADFNYSQRLFSDRLNVRTGIKGSRQADSFTPGGVLSNAAQMGPTQPILDPTSTSGFYNWPGNQLTSADNPAEILKYSTDNGTTLRSIGNLTADYRFPFMDALKATVNLGYDVAKATRTSFDPSLLHAQQKNGNKGHEYRRDDTQQNTVLESYLNYAAPLNVLPGNLDLTAGYSYNFSHGDYPWWTADGLSTDLLGTNGIPGARQMQNGLSIQENKLISWFGRANYNFKDKYIVGASLRRDGSSRFGPANAWGTFPSVSAAWRISEESFLKGNPTISDLKLRGSWGKTGNQAFANYRQYTVYEVGDAQSQVWFDGQWVTTIRPSAADQNIKWEETKAIDVGLDYGLFNNKVTGAIDYYKKSTSDMLFEVPIAAGTNLSNFLLTNIGSMKNNGLEANLSTKIFDGGKDGFTWSVDFNASHNANELTQINPFAGGAQQILTGGVAGGVGTFAQVFTPGSPINSFFVYQHKRENGKPIFKDVTGLTNGKFDNKPDGQINEQDLYVDINGDGKIDVNDRRPFHNPQPNWMLGHSSYMTKGNLDASFTLRAYLGNYVYNNVASNLGTYQEVGRGSPYNLHASVLKTGFTSPQYLSDYYVEDASFLRMDNINVGYTLKYQDQPMRVFVGVQNVFTLTGYSGVDPTAGLNGIDNNIYPRSRTFSAGLNVRF